MSQSHYLIPGKIRSRGLFAAFMLLAGVCKGQPVLTVAVTNPTCAYNNGSFVVSATGGTAPYNYASNAARESNSTGVFGGLAAGTYDLTVRDSKGKQTTASVVLTSPGTFPYFTSAVVNATGCTTDNGQVTLTPAGGTAPYQYSIDDGASFQASNVFGNLAPGSYSILIEDANGCITAPWSAIGVSYANFQLWSQAKFVNVTAPTCSLVLGATPSAPACGNNNSLTVSASGGTGPYTYSVDGGAFGALVGGKASGLSPGEHTVTVKDATNATVSYSYTFANDCAVATTQTPSTCGMSTGTITVTQASGIPPFSYSMDGTNFQGSATFSNLAAGTYTFLVKDAHGVISYGAGNIAQVCFAATATTTTSNCDASTGTITAKGVNGNPPYMYSLDNITYVATPLFPGLKGGYYTVYVEDASLQVAKTIVAVQDQCMTLGTAALTASCGKANGQITVNLPTGGTAPYSYSNSSGNFYQVSNVFPNLAAGNYTFTVKDANGNIQTVVGTVPGVQGPQIATIPTAASCLNNDGAVQITTTGGTGPFNVSFDAGPSALGKLSWSGLDSGTHTINITDANGCQAAATALVPLTDTLTVTAGTVPPTCQGVGVVLPIGSNDSNAARFAWTPSGSLSDSTVAGPVAAPAATTTYTVTASVGGCVKTATITVTILPAPVAVAGAPDTICPGKSVQLQGSGGGLYQWSPATYLSDPAVANPMVQQPASTVSYHLTVTDANGCSSVDTAITTVVVSAPPKVFAGNDTAVVIGQPLQLHAVDVDGSGFTSFAWSPAEGLSDPAIADPTTVVSGDVVYTVVATTTLGCVATGSVKVSAVTIADIIVPNAFTPNNDGHNDMLKVNAWGIKSLKYFRVYNRYGQAVFSSLNANDGWDGTIGGQRAPAGAYVWAAAGVDFTGRAVARKGTVILIR